MMYGFLSITQDTPVFPMGKLCWCTRCSQQDRYLAGNHITFFALLSKIMRISQNHNWAPAGELSSNAQYNQLECLQKLKKILNHILHLLLINKHNI